MPKVITVEKGASTPTTTDGWLAVRYVRVGWKKRAGQVQLATCFARSGIHEQPPDGATVDVPGLLVELDRDGVNAVIASLRQARDEAFPDA